GPESVGRANPRLLAVAPQRARLLRLEEQPRPPPGVGRSEARRGAAAAGRPGRARPPAPRRRLGPRPRGRRPDRPVLAALRRGAAAGGRQAGGRGKDVAGRQAGGEPREGGGKAVTRLPRLAPPPARGNRLP